MRSKLKDCLLIGVLALSRHVKPAVLANYDVERVNELIRYGPVRLLCPDRYSSILPDGVPLAT